MLGRCWAYAKVTPRHKTVTKTLRCVLPAELGMTRKPHKRYETRAIDGQRTGTARPFPLWRLPSGPYHRPSIQIFGSGIPPGPNSWPPNIPPANSVPTATRLSLILPNSVARLLHTAD